jgi:hypothetical protein
MSQQHPQHPEQEKATSLQDKSTNPHANDYLAINRARWDERAPHVS